LLHNLNDSKIIAAYKIKIKGINKKKNKKYLIFSTKMIILFSIINKKKNKLAL
tara:strand:- start:11532 stop:11690 length:159 start_codon:yes stop_codon:yes gene_type:complete